jgi:hypothetical protein
MDEEIERLVVGVRADTSAFARDVAEMRTQLEGPLAAGADRAGHALEHALLRAVRTGKVGFEDLKRVALSAMAEIAAAAIRSRGDRWRRDAPIWSASAGRSCSSPRPAVGSRRHAPAGLGTFA